MNICTATDSYKMAHYAMYPEGTKKVYSYFESRKGAKFDETVFFGLQSLLKELEGQVVTQSKIDFAEKLTGKHLGNEEVFNAERWQYILDKYDGRLPVRIKAIPEGTAIPTGNVLLTIENLDENCFWLTNHLETFLTHLWYPSTVASLSRDVKKTLKESLERTGSSEAMLDFMLHDFGMRGVSSMQSADMGGLAHLTQFKGTDTIVALERGMSDYQADLDNLGFSVLATEHSIMTAKGREGEEEVIESLLDQYPTGVLSIVCDSYDIYNCVENILGDRFRDKVLARDGVTVIRPDSGDPVTVVRKLLTIMKDRFGGEVNEAGYYVLNPKVRLIWGDGIDAQGIAEILEAMIDMNFATENIVFGMGGGLLQKVNRDTQRFAFKCSARQDENGVWQDVYKDPIDGSKASKRGRLKLIEIEGEYKTVRQEENGEDLLVTVFENGEIIKTYKFDEVRQNTEI